MKIAIYGDSYADNVGPWLENGQTIENLYKRWINHFEDNYDVTCYGNNGSNLYYSKNIFDRTHSEYDKVIFMITMPQRYYVRPDDPKLNTTRYYLSGNKKLEKLLNSAHVSDTEKMRLRIQRDYNIHIRDEEYETYIHNLMAQDISIRRPDAIVINNFDYSTYDSTIGMWDVSEHEREILNFSKSDRDLRKCHLTKENNFRLFEIVEDAVITNKTCIDIDISYFETEFDQSQIVIQRDDRILRIGDLK